MNKRDQLADLILDRTIDMVASLNGTEDDKEASFVLTLGMNVLANLRDVYLAPSESVGSASEETQNA